MVRTVEPRKKAKVHISSGRSTEWILKRLILRIKYLHQFCHCDFISPKILELHN